MKRIAHLSDLHFGRDRPDLIGPLIARVNSLKPDLVAISGDLTQRARRRQFRAARDFIDALDPPVLVVPGNHDVPLRNPLARMVRPWRNYRRWIGSDLEPAHADDEMIVVGVNTVDPFSWQRGWFGRAAIRRVCEAFAAADEARARVVVAHHPMEHMPGQPKQLMRGAARALLRLSECGADVVLTGHLHTWRAEPFAVAAGRAAPLQVHAGTGLSTRLREEENDFNLVSLTARRISVERYAVGTGASAFRKVATRRFVRSGRGWRTERG